MNKKLFGILGILLFIFLIYKVVETGKDVNFNELSINYLLLAISFIILILYIIYSGILWSYILKKLYPSSNLFISLKAFVNSILLKYLPGGFLNLFGRVFYLKKEGIPIIVSSSSLVYEMILIVLSSICIGGYLILSYEFIPAFIYFIILGILLSFVIFPNLLISIINRLLTIINYSTIKVFLLRKDIIFIFLLYVLGWFVWGSAFKLFLLSLGYNSEINFFVLNAIFSTSWVVGYLSPFPGGIGIREGALIILLQNTPISGDAYLISVLSRLWLIIGEVILVILFLLFHFIKRINVNEKIDRKSNI